MSRPLTVEQLNHNLRDTTEGLYGFRWDHYDVLSEARSNAALDAINAETFPIRAAKQHRETLFEELMKRIAPYMPDSTVTEREGGEVWQDKKAFMADIGAVQITLTSQEADALLSRLAPPYASGDDEAVAHYAVYQSVVNKILKERE